jgi:ankyrin repeat protein
MNGHDKVIDILIKSGADPSIPDGSGALPVDYADFRGHDSLAHYLLPKSVPKDITPEKLFDLIDDNDIESLAFALSAGVDPNYFNGNEYPIHHALRTGHLNAAIALVKGGADINTRSKGSTALHVAAYKGYTPFCKLLIKNGADVNEKNSQSGNTPLLYAMRNGKVETAKELINMSADPLIANNFGDTPLMEAINDRSNKYMNLMMSTGALNRVNREVLMSMCVQAGRTGLAFTLSVGKGDYSEFEFISDTATPLQVLAFAESTNPLKTLDLIKSQSSLGHTITTFCLVDSFE